jgi:hypothetical protein
MKFNITDIILKNKLGEELDLKKSNFVQLANLIGFPDSVEFLETNKSFCAHYTNSNIEIYYKDDFEVIDQFKIYSNLIFTDKDEHYKSLLFKDFNFFYKSAEEILRTIINSKKRVFYIDEISDEYSGYYYLVEGEIMLYFNDCLSPLHPNIQLESISMIINGTASWQAKYYNAKEINQEYFVLPPLFNEVERFPKGKIVDF